MSGPTTGDVGFVDLQTLECGRCGLSWQRPRSRGQRPRLCPSCKTHGGTKAGSRRLDTNTAGYRLALAVTNQRLAIEEAASALYLGKYDEALAALNRVRVR